MLQYTVRHVHYTRLITTVPPGVISCQMQCAACVPNGSEVLCAHDMSSHDTTIPRHCTALHCTALHCTTPHQRT